MEAPVLVVGGRTTGLMMGSELALHGVPVRVIDASPGIDPHSRATLLHSRTLEIFDTRGIADPVVALGQPMRRIRLYANGKLVGQSQEDAVDSPFPNGIALSQAKTEAILERHLNALSVVVERDTRLTAIDQHADGVRATIEHPDRRREIVETPWLIGCDGAHSTVRHLTEERFVGEADPFPYLLADVVLEGPAEPDDVHIYLHDDGELFFFVLDEGRRFVVASGAKGREVGRPPSLEQMQRLVTRRSQAEFRLVDPRWLAAFHIQYRLAPHYRHGRTFLAGDAAHIHSLLGGQGMNTGIQDAHNLAWKLALVQREIVPETWLASYEIERRRVAEDVVAMTKAATQTAELFAELSARDRARLCEHMFAPESEKMRARRHAEELDLDYRSSPLCMEVDGEFVDGPHAGAQAWDAAPILVDGTECPFFDLMRSPRHCLLLFAGPRGAATPEEITAAARHAREAYGAWIDVFVVCERRAGFALPPDVSCIEDPQRRFHARYGAAFSCSYLIRPDGHVAHRSRGLDGASGYLSRVL